MTTAGVEAPAPTHPLAHRAWQGVRNRESPHEERNSMTKPPRVNLLVIGSGKAGKTLAKRYVPQKGDVTRASHFALLGLQFIPEKQG